MFCVTHESDGIGCPRCVHHRTSSVLPCARCESTYWDGQLALSQTHGCLAYCRVWEGNVTSEQTYSSNFAVKPQVLDSSLKDLHNTVALVDTATTTYDMLSLMHFGVFAFSRDGRTEID
eukprot:457033-Amphidinium_carterae.1